MSDISGRDTHVSAAKELPRSVAGAVPVDNSIPQHLKCESCKQANFNAFQSSHGCRLCQSCILDWQRDAEQGKKCPCNSQECTVHTDQRLINQAPCNPDLGTRREINVLKVFCPNRAAGCPHGCRWVDMDGHLNTSCDFELTACDLCPELVARHQLDSGHKNLLSESCCSNFQSPCPHCKGPELLGRRTFLQHLQSPCPQRPEACRYAHRGCQVMLSKDSMEQHYKNCADDHLKLLDDQLCDRDEVVRSLTEENRWTKEHLKLVDDQLRDRDEVVRSLTEENRWTKEHLKLVDDQLRDRDVAVKSLTKEIKSIKEFVGHEKTFDRRSASSGVLETVDSGLDSASAGPSASLSSQRALSSDKMQSLQRHLRTVGKESEFVLALVEINGTNEFRQLESVSREPLLTLLNMLSHNSKWRDVIQCTLNAIGEPDLVSDL